ncbi:uncharacterized protein PHACADRAFT_250840 [Phanerochaete carnosa HHB-10118-sp]|uniref:UBA domain-containing protein n=1 Tax=Phanerochaete carnosa (strain HHB-10118-sp) TaxID=650164 RepID=K5WLD9_PHACS|nr:uncharacterized protein PHACADRAFT_250840 [Phanerochaete carnosa HHB-10118-sp]EKM59999.1 hypothetical protein PHACADRAFT_250840 [Phanerochaete carnosa HHB-10118-sp]
MSPATQSSAWVGLDALGSSSSLTASTVPSKTPSIRVDDDHDWTSAFNQPAKPSAPAPASANMRVIQATDDDWGLDDFVSKPASMVAPSSQPSSKTGSLWELDEFSSPVASGPIRTSPGHNVRSSTPGSFDFGDREDGLLNDASGDENDILGELGRPVQPELTRPMDAPATRATPSPHPPVAQSRSRAVSPPPHVLGQIVEMGFSIQQARVALTATDTGLDVQAALEMLLSNGAASSSTPPPEPPSRERPRERRDEDPALSGQRIPGRRDKRREQPSRESSGPGERNLQEQADKLLAQASEIGLSVFSRANALWKQGREKVQQVYEERAVAPGADSRGSRQDGRPRWMQEGSREEGEGGPADHPGGFRDSDEDVPVPAKYVEQRRRSTEPKVTPSQRPREETPPKVKTADLLSEDAPSVYVSPYRRKTPARSQLSTPAELVSRQAPPKAPEPAPLVQRKTVPASPSEIATSAKHKAAGTEMFKLGRYAEAETSYSYAIAALPDSHLLLVPLYNNRALTRIKTGDYNGAIEDCTTVLKIIGSGYHPAREARVTNDDEGAGADLADAYIKALRRRAEAYEGKEKWDNARKDWEAIAAAEWAGKARNEAAQAAGRCRRMLNTDPGTPASSAAAAPSKPKPQARPRPVQRVPTPPSEALNRVREANQAAEAEDQERHALKDDVDARLMVWKGGKETNLRALVASLDSVLWPELGWQKVGMHELVTPAQVKIRYTKAIAKLHPDKLNTRNTTLEQRMIANGVFGSLNEAWNAFKQ